MVSKGQAVAHTLYQGGDDMVTQIHQIGSSKITVHSPTGVIALSGDEQREWFQEAWQAGHPVVRGIAYQVTQISNTQREEH